ncbi:unnamed protein product [Hermetia illucens]|uniref:Integrase zinc-binding domain-containing protein n=1 Tax=Hermetia illucens TaxID=343691 RepID=A0A7R8UBN8_HERIL|nr:unnamed protein product [Hermetia illucens]
MPATVAIYSEVDDHQYKKLQQIILEGFDNTVTKFIKVTQIVKEITNEDDLIDRIKHYHQKETGHAGIRENYSGLKNQIYYPNLHKYIHRYINACQVCNENKVDRKSIKPKFQITEIPKDIRMIGHLDLLLFKNLNILVMINKFSKFASGIVIPSRHKIDIRSGVLSILVTPG